MLDDRRNGDETMSGKTLAMLAASLLLVSTVSTAWAAAKPTKSTAHIERQHNRLYNYVPDAAPAAPGAPGTTYDAPPYHYGWVPPR
jgi:hypothetical protein